MVPVTVYLHIYLEDVYFLYRGQDMIIVQNQFVKPEDFSTGLTKNAQIIVKQMADYTTKYEFESIDQLKFELLFRINTLKAAMELNGSKAKFTTFQYAFCNPKYWYRLSNGGFLLKNGVLPSIAILDILKNGRFYAFECSTAIAIVLYLSTLYSIGPKLFDRFFDRLYLMDWQFDEDLPIYQKQSNDFLQGDVLHFNNPEFDPKQPHWRAENVVFFGDDRYYGHGIGIKSAETIIGFLNTKRKPKATKTAYLMSQITRPVYRNLYQLSIQK